MKAAGDLVNAADYALAFRLLEPLPEQPGRMLMLLHGVGGHEGQLAALGARVSADTLVVLTRAPRSVGGDAVCAGRIDRAWQVRREVAGRMGRTRRRLAAPTGGAACIASS